MNQLLRFNSERKYLKQVNSTSRSNGAVGKKALVPRLVQKLIPKSKTILDFGAGKKAIHTKRLRRKGYKVAAWDVGANFDPSLHDRKALSRKYDVVMASNVLNVQPSAKKLQETLANIVKLRSRRGIVIVNYPKSPRYNAVGDYTLLVKLSRYGRVTKLPSNIYILER